MIRMNLRLGGTALFTGEARTAGSSGGTSPRLFHANDRSKVFKKATLRPPVFIRGNTVVKKVSQPFRTQRSNQLGFTIVEAMIALVITAMASSAILLGIQSSIQTTNHSLEQTIACGMAQQLIDEIMAVRYSENSDAPHETKPGPEINEASTGTRELFDDVDDFNGYSSRPPTDRFGIPLGIGDGVGWKRNPNFYASPNFFDNWEQRVSVCYVSPSDATTPLAADQTSDYRMVKVTILHHDPINGVRELIKLNRVVAYVPPIQ